MMGIDSYKIAPNLGPVETRSFGINPGYPDIVVGKGGVASQVASAVALVNRPNENVGAGSRDRHCLSCLIWTKLTKNGFIMLT